MSKFREVVFNLFVIITSLLIVAIFVAPFFLMCDHDNLYGVRLSERSCTTSANVEVICLDCNMLMESRMYGAYGHEFGEYEIAYEPGVYSDGLEIRKCKNCDLTEERTYSCEHQTSFSHIPRKSTCVIKGVELFICEDCKTPTDERLLDLIEHDFGDWKTTKTATPVQKGEKARYCNVCDFAETKSYTMSMAGSNSIYIPGTGINHRVAVASFTQAAVDTYNIVYASTTWNSGSNDPFVLGHNTGTMGALPRTRVGQYIYLSIGGRIEVYKVMVSEYAREINEEIIGQRTGVSMWRNYGVKTLHLYTCHGGGNGRWLVLAKKVG